jgi:hypothetical protein
MKAIDKANELVDTYRMMLMNEDTDFGQEILCTIIAKKSALIAVDTVLWMASHYATKQYWEQVKLEIQKL